MTLPAVLIFKTEERSGSRTERPGVGHYDCGGLPGIFRHTAECFTVWLAPRLLAGHLGLPATPDGETSTKSRLATWAITHLLRSRNNGLILGWFIIRPVNAILHGSFAGSMSFD